MAQVHELLKKGKSILKHSENIQGYLQICSHMQAIQINVYMEDWNGLALMYIRLNKMMLN